MSLGEEFGVARVSAPPVTTASAPGGYAPTSRRIDRTTNVTRLGPDSQVDDKALVVAPGDWSKIDPFLLMAEDWFSHPGFDWHPHRGIETVTIVLDGALEHGDNHGSTGLLGPGDVQWMTAGDGIIHRELAFRNEHAHNLQLWVNLPKVKKAVPPRYQDLPFDDLPAVTGRGVVARLISGAFGDVSGPADNQHPITGMQLSLEPDSSITIPLDGRDRAFLYVMSGTVDAGVPATRLAGGQVGWSDPMGTGSTTLSLTATSGDDVARAVLFSGEPIGERVVAGGPFVMNTEEEIRKAYRDYRSGSFGPVPRLARL